ncbi:MAG: sodium:calcium antiporter [Cellulosilyticaceae bacterium]
MIFLMYLVLAAIVVGLSIKLSHYVDLIDKTTDLSGAFIGGVMLAAVTSLPELFTSISATLFLNKSELVLGNILGSNIFNITILSVLILVMYKKFSECYIAKSHTTVVGWLIVIYGLLTIPVFFKQDPSILGISLVSIVIAIIYMYCVRKMAADTNEEDEGEEEVYTDLTTRQLFIRFILLSCILVAASIGITYVTDMIAVKLNLGMTLAGALLLGIATSLPEVTSSITLAKMGNFNATVGNILGSNIFNLFVLVLADLLFRSGTIYTANIQSYNLVFFGAISTLAVMSMLKVKEYKSQVKEKVREVVYIGGGVISIIGYILFLSLSQ